MTLEQLTEFITVARLKNFSKAAETLYITQSALSRHIAALEADLGVVLMVRNNRFVQLTHAGEVLYADGQQALEQWKALELNVIRAGSGITGGLTVYSQPLYNDTLFSAYKNFCEKYPDVVFRMKSGSSDRPLENLRTGEADVVITFSFVLDEDIEGIKVMSLYNEKFCIVVSGLHPLANRKSVSVTDLKNEPLLSLQQQSYPIIDRLHDYTHTAPPTDTQEMFLRVKAGLGWTIVPRPVAEEYGSGCAIFDIDDPESEYEVVLTWLGGGKNPCTKLFRECVYSAFNRSIPV